MSLAVFKGDVLERGVQAEHFRFVWDGVRIKSVYRFDRGETIKAEELQAKATSRSTSLDVCSRAVAWLSALAAVVSVRTAVGDCRVGGGKEFGARQPDARADGKPIGADESVSRRAVLSVCPEGS
jgi:hypothetical protein